MLLAEFLLFSLVQYLVHSKSVSRRRFKIQHQKKGSSRIMKIEYVVILITSMEVSGIKTSLSKQSVLWTFVQFCLLCRMQIVVKLWMVYV